ncbi:P-loop NTPase family protein [Candidatus Phycorickettsia trachydisci]|nr:DNA topology modulation protein [Candidatus Phycorickettsia trachydisci]
MVSRSRIMIFGRPGSGKSTFAFALSKALKLPLHHLDKHFYVANWIERNYSEFLEIQKSIVANSSWIIDGNSTKSLEIRYSKADLILYFNYPRWICYWRILKRYFYKNSKFDDRAEGCHERITWSLLCYMWSFETRVANKIQKLRTKYPKPPFIEIKNDIDLSQLKKELTIP